MAQEIAYPLGTVGTVIRTPDSVLMLISFKIRREMNVIILIMKNIHIIVNPACIVFVFMPMQS